MSSISGLCFEPDLSILASKLFMFASDKTGSNRQCSFLLLCRCHKLSPGASLARQRQAAALILADLQTAPSVHAPSLASVKRGDLWTGGWN